MFCEATKKKFMGGGGEAHWHQKLNLLQTDSLVSLLPPSPPPGFHICFLNQFLIHPVVELVCHLWLLSATLSCSVTSSWDLLRVWPFPRSPSSFSLMTGIFPFATIWPEEGFFFFKRKSLQVIPCLKPSKGFHCPSERLFPAPPGPSRLRPCSPLQPQLGLPPPPALTLSHPGLLNSIPTGFIPKPPGKFLPLPASPPPCSKQHFGAGVCFPEARAQLNSPHSHKTPL